MSRTPSAITAIAFIIFMVSIASAHSAYKGFSGAPGSLGTCTASCHPIRSFDPDISVEGFPEYYQPGVQYTISVTNSSGLHIHQFNASVRVGTGSDNAGTILPGVGTAVYDTSGETNGVRWEWPNTASGGFIWIAPDPGVGEVSFYWAGLQGYRTYGADTSLVLVSHEAATGIGDYPEQPAALILNQNYPNPFNGNTRIEYVSPRSGPVNFSVYDISGRMVYSKDIYSAAAGPLSIFWDGITDDGVPLPSGVYFYRLLLEGKSITRKMVILR